MPFTSNIFMLLLLSWNKSKATRQERTAKKQERSQKETKKQGRTKKINKRKRETGNEKEKWRKPRRKKVRHWEMNKNNPFSGGKQCFCKQTNKKTKRKERFRANCPKTHVQGCVDPSWRRKRRKEQNTKRREGIFKRSLFKFAKTQSTKEHRKTSEKTSAPQPQADFWQRPESNPNRDGGVKTKTRQKLHKLGPARAKWEKRHFQNFLGSAAPGLFFAFQNQFGQKFELPKKTNLWDAEKFASKMNCNMKALQRVQRKSTRPLQRKIAPKPLVLKRFASHYLLDCAWKSPDQKHTQKTKICSDLKKRPRRPPKWHFWKTRKIRKQWGNLVSGHRKKTISRYKNSGFKKGGPQINPWGAAN